MSARLSAPIAILDEHPEWSTRLMTELGRRRLPFERIDHTSHAFDPRDRRARYSVVVNRTSPSSHRRGHGSVLFYTEALLDHYAAIGVPVVNGVAAYRFEKSKALQIGLFERLRLPYPRTIVVNDRQRLGQAARRELAFPVLVKPNVGGSGAGIVRFDSHEALRAAAPDLDFGPDGTVLVQEYLEAEGGAIFRVEVLGSRWLYAIRIVRGDDFNLCPADVCAVPPSTAGVACTATRGLEVRRADPPPEAIAGAIALARAASIDVGGVEYLVNKVDGRVYYYDVNATSNFVANAPAVVGFDPVAEFVDYIQRVATGAGRRAAA
jgi:glutathione synthase/RimK-type ligase-like ATP-grasp enzyme